MAVSYPWERPPQPVEWAAWDSFRSRWVVEQACTRCGEVKQLSEFYVEERRPLGRRQDCIVCKRAGRRVADG